MAVDVLKALYDKEMDVDLFLKVESDERQIKCHRLILKAASKYFEIMFSSDFVERDSNVITLHLEGMIFETLEMITKCVYTEELYFNELVAIKDAILAADYLMVDHVIAILSEHVEKTVSQKNAIEIFQVRDKLKSEAGLAVRDYILAQFKSANDVKELKANGLLSLNFTDFQELMKAAPSGLDTFAVLKAWTNEKPERKIQFSKLFSCIKFVDAFTVEYINNEMLPMCSCEESFKHLICILSERANNYYERRRY